ncbi:Autophagy-related protein [Actinidia chinensis var. chinensis]|uniref:Autophagy-related protein n=1 Tax=Actinidia chinensis var. chinensis TaxID=1590841 RepID=A0A2R6P6H7_ACTCC|nr:Autophagy-related protein [Actinidia chinensis var. chinensis]
MAYRRRQGEPRPSTLKEEFGRPHLRPPPPPPPDESSSSSSASSLAAKAIRASSAHRDSSLSSVYDHSSLSPSGDPNLDRSSPPSVPKDSTNYEYTSMKKLSEPKHGFWEGLTKKARSIMEGDNEAQQLEPPGRTRPQMSSTVTRGQYQNRYPLPESHRKTDKPALHRGFGAITSSLNYIGGTIGNALEEGLNIVETRTADIIQETRKLQIRKERSSSEKQNQNQTSNVGGARQQPPKQPQMQTDLEIQLKASRDVAMAMSAKAKLLLRELKTVKADLAFAKERCAQLEEENRILRVSLEKGDNPEDDDLIRLQLETLLAEKARLAQENSVFARENRFLREIVEYHQLTMQDVVYFDEGREEVTEVYPIKIPPVTNNAHSIGTMQPSAPPSFPTPDTRSPRVAHDVSPLSTPSHDLADISPTFSPLSSFIHIPGEENLERRSDPA